MKTKNLILAAALAGLVTGCTTTPTKTCPGNSSAACKTAKGSCGSKGNCSAKNGCGGSSGCSTAKKPASN